MKLGTIHSTQLCMSLLWILCICFYAMSCSTNRLIGYKSSDSGMDTDSIQILNAISKLEMEKIPHYEIAINLHYIKHPEYGTFYKGVGDDMLQENGLHWAKLLINHANWALDSLGNSPASKENMKGDAHYNFKLYTEPNYQDDSFGGIWFWDHRAPAIFPYGDRVLNIVLQDDGKRLLNGSACGLNFCHSLILYGAYHNVKFNGKFGWWAFASLLNHEVGHIFGLCHSFSCDNECAGIDLDPAVECHKGPCYDDCGGPNYGLCNNWLANSNNMMGYNANQNALTPCQWKRLMINLYHTNAKYVKRLQQNAWK